MTGIEALTESQIEALTESQLVNVLQLAAQRVIEACSFLWWGGLWTGLVIGGLASSVMWAYLCWLVYLHGRKG